MTTEEILNSLTDFQRIELNNDIAAIVKELSESNKIADDKFGEVNVNLRLDNSKILLNVTILCKKDDKGGLQGELIVVSKFNNEDEYLDAMNESSNKGSDWQKIK